MTPEQHQQFIEEVQSTIKTTVNGKIDDLKKTTLTKEDFGLYVKEDMRWKEDAQPALDNMKNLRTTWKGILGLSLGISAIGGALFILKKIFNV